MAPRRRPMLALLAATPGERTIRDLDLHAAFGTRAAWRLTVTQAPAISDPVLGGGPVPGALTLCLRPGPAAACDPLLADLLREEGSEDLRGRPYELQRLAIVPPLPRRPLLLVRTASLRGANGNQRVGTDLLAYDRGTDRFRRVYCLRVGPTPTRRCGMWTQARSPAPS